jgi:phosphonopyruvate decarboxylase
MIGAAGLIAELARCGVTTMTGVPCSYLTPVINQAIADPAVRYLAATQEGEAVAIAAGAWLGGGLGCAIGQNSGLGNMVNPLTSLLQTSRIPTVLLVTWRGRPGERDEPQHELMGRITTGLLDLMEVGWTMLPADPAELAGAVAAACHEANRRAGPFALVVGRDTVAPVRLVETAPGSHRTVTARHPADGATAPTRAEVLERMLAELPAAAAVVATTGWTSRQLYTLADREQHFYLVGAMGSASGVGLGVAQHTALPVVVVDGDGALLMRLGSLATVGVYGGRNLTHLVLDNGAHESTGGQRTLSAGVDLVAAAAACGYAQAHDAGDLAGFTAALRAALAGPGPTFVRVRTRLGAPAGLGRPAVTPAEVARRFRAFVAGAPGDPGR